MHGLVNSEVNGEMHIICSIYLDVDVACVNGCEPLVMVHDRMEKWCSQRIVICRETVKVFYRPTRSARAVNEPVS